MYVCQCVCYLCVVPVGDGSGLFVGLFVAIVLAGVVCGLWVGAISWMLVSDSSSSVQVY